MDITELSLRTIQGENGNTTVALFAGDKAVIGVDSVSIGSDEAGSFLDLRVRRFALGEVVESEPGPETDGGEDGPNK